jgi:hypothetical protein
MPSTTLQPYARELEDATYPDWHTAVHTALFGKLAEESLHMASPVQAAAVGRGGRSLALHPTTAKYAMQPVSGMRCVSSAIERANSEPVVA